MAAGQFLLASPESRAGFYSGLWHCQAVYLRQHPSQLFSLISHGGGKKSPSQHACGVMNTAPAAVCLLWLESLQGLERRPGEL